MLETGHICAPCIISGISQLQSIHFLFPYLSNKLKINLGERKLLFSSNDFFSNVISVGIISILPIFSITSLHDFGNSFNVLSITSYKVILYFAIDKYDSA